MKCISYFWGGFATSLNIFLYALTGGRFLWLEGRVTNGIFRNWAKRFKYRPKLIHLPTTETELISLIKNSRKLRVFGSGHSFNEGVVSAEALLSLDQYNSILDFKPDLKLITVQAGMRVRDISKVLLERGLAFVALPSHDAQSIGGILSTDVHGTGRDWGFVSESVISMKIIDGRGIVNICHPEDELFRAAVGGVGTVGVISEVTIQAIDRFNIKQSFQMSTLSYVEKHFDSLHANNEHFGFYLFPFTQKCQINTWNSTDTQKSTFGTFREFIAISADALMASWFGNFLAYTRLLPRLSDLSHGIKHQTNLVLESHNGHNRSIYHLHQELEMAVEYTEVFRVSRELMMAYEELYQEGLPYLIFEIRFSPAGHNQTLIGPGRSRQSAWIDIICCDSPGFELFYQRAEEIFKSVGGRPHLGKYCRGFKSRDLKTMHGKYYRQFIDLTKKHDPDGKFSNSFTKRLFDSEHIQ